MALECIRLGRHCHCFQGPTNLGLIELDDGHVCLIDSGNGKEAGRKIRQQLEANQWRLQAIYNTHAHPDHVGGNAYLQRQTGCAVYAPGPEAALARHPLLFPGLLAGGYPPSELRQRELLAEASEADPLTSETLPDGLTMLPLSGHSPAMTGFAHVDGVVFLADCLSSEATLAKYGINYLYDVAGYIDTLNRVEALDADVFVPSHAPVTDDIAPLVRLNLNRVHETADMIVAIAAAPTGFEAILQRLCEQLGIELNFVQYALIGSTLRSYLAWLSDAGRIRSELSGNRLVWRRA